MTINRVNFNPIASGGDTPTGALVKLDQNDASLQAQITAGSFATVTATSANSNFGSDPGNVVANINIGKGSSSANSYIDFFAGGSATNNVNQAARILVSGGSGASNTGTMTISAASLVIGNCTLSSAGTLTMSGALTAQAVFCRAGINGAVGANRYNLNFVSGAMQLWVDTTNLGNISVTSSDSRIKQDITYPAASDDLTTALALKPVEFRYLVGSAYDDGSRHRSFIAQDANNVSAMLSEGKLNAVDDSGNVIPMGIDIKALLSVCVGAIQALSAKVDALTAQVEALQPKTT